MNVNGHHYRTVWFENNQLKLINQHCLPQSFSIHSCSTWPEVANAISDMTVRGAPAIGAAAGYGLALAAREAPDADFSSFIRDACIALRNTRPTAHNLFFALDRVLAAITNADSPRAARSAARREADAIAGEDVNACRLIGEYGSALISDGMTILTHCNAGWLATVDWGTALAPLYAAARRGVQFTVLADETRPRCQGSRLTAWELMQEGINVEIIADNAAGYFFSNGDIDLCIVGADRIAANGDVANKIGTYEKAVLAARHAVPFYVAAPSSTFDRGCPTGDEIIIEERSPDEVLSIEGFDDQGRPARVRLSPPGALARNPAFDITPAELIAGIITENGIVTF